MNKTIVFIGVGIVTILSAILLTVFLVHERTPVMEQLRTEDVVTQKETALVIGKALLEEYTPYNFSNYDWAFDAVEENGIWRVYGIVEESAVWNDGRLQSLDLDGGMFVEFRRDTCEVIRIGLEG